ncbi:class F sortase [Candidatus Kaiserbacteria bacterium]|nr:class F sortase [Candidatus Kaiserbacteria bacterium]
MQHFKKVIAAMLFIGGVAVFGGTLVRAVFYAPEREVPLPASEKDITLEHESSSNVPRRLEIPSLHIDTNVQHVGRGVSGNMAVPSNYSDVGWYRYGTLPGEQGSAVIDGHVDNGLGLSGVFKHLGSMERGDDVYIITKGGSRLHFVVEEIAVYDYKNVPLEKLFERTDTARLNLITCGGRWIKNDKTYDHRIVVYATLLPN